MRDRKGAFDRYLLTFGDEVEYIKAEAGVTYIDGNTIKDFIRNLGT